MPRTKVRLLHIDPKAKKISEVIVNHLKEIPLIAREMCGWDYMTFVYDPSGHYAFLCDDMGLMKPDPGPFWKSNNYHSPIAGKAMMVGLTYPEGDYKNNNMSLEAANKLISFPDLRFIGFEESQGEIHHPLFGKMFQIKRVAKFEEIGSVH